MERLDHDALASILANTSTSTLAGLLCADHDDKARTAQLLAREIVDRLSPPACPDRNRMALPF